MPAISDILHAGLLTVSSDYLDKNVCKQDKGRMYHMNSTQQAYSADLQSIL